MVLASTLGDVTSLRLDHCAIGVTDPVRAATFWSAVAGAEVIELPRGLQAYRFGDQQLTVHGLAATPQPPGKVPPGTSHVALVWPGPIAEGVAHLERHGIEIEHGPARVEGAHGAALSVYFRDPDGSLVEFISYSE